jgi:hypothetical protein
MCYHHSLTRTQRWSDGSHFEENSLSHVNIVLSRRQRRAFHGLLHRDLRKCSTSVLSSFQRNGWATGAGDGYQLTALGRRIAEFSEQAPADRDLEVNLDLIPT